MQLNQLLSKRSQGKCELCGSSEKLSAHEVAFAPYSDVDGTVLICPTCLAQIEKKAELNDAHWRFLETSMWSEVPGIKVISWRMLNRLKDHSWASDALDMLYLEDDMLNWAKAAGDHENDATVVLHRDSNGHILHDGDSVVLIKSLDVKGSTLNAKMGTVVRNIRLVADNTDQIEGKIEGQQIVILTQYLRRQNS